MTDNRYARPTDPATAPDPGSSASRQPPPVSATPTPAVGDGSVLVSAVTVRYGAVTAIAQVDLLVAPGTFLALTGPSGAGKSTLLWAIAGAVRPETGQVVVRGRRISDRQTGIQADVTLIPQGNGLTGVLTAYENIVFPLLSNGVPPAAAGTRASSSLVDVGLAESGNHLVEELSGGQQQRVAVARSLATHADVLLADEPTSELDHANRGLVLELLRDAAHRGAVVVMATHDPEAAAVADGEVRFDEGRLTTVR